jgi:hypothetical protein
MARRTRKQSRKHSRKHRKQQGGENAANSSNASNTPPAPNASSVNATMKQQGGKRKGTRKLSPWNKFVQKIYREMKSKSKSATFSQALKEASKRKKEM